VTTIDATRLSTDRLASLVAGKHKILELLVQLAQRQLVLAREGEVGDLLKLLAAKQTVLGQLQTLERELDPFRPQDPESRLWASAAARQSCQAQANRCDQLLAEAVRLEKLGEAEMVRRRDVAASALQGASDAAHAHSAYAGSPHTIASPLQFHCEG
jgi:hypothetical protein